jgi:hypothetical protein
MARGIYRTVLLTGLRPRLFIHRRPLRRLLSFQRGAGFKLWTYHHCSPALSLVYMEVLCEALARQSTVALLFQLQLLVPGLSRMSFCVVAYGFQSHHRSVLRSLFRSLHGLLGVSAHRPVSTCLSVFNLSVCHLSVYHFSVDLIGWLVRLPALLFPPHPPFCR